MHKEPTGVTINREQRCRLWNAVDMKVYGASNFGAEELFSVLRELRPWMRLLDAIGWSREDERERFEVRLSEEGWALTNALLSEDVAVEAEVSEGASVVALHRVDDDGLSLSERMDRVTRQAEEILDLIKGPRSGRQERFG